MDGAATLAFTRRQESTVLADLYQRAPLRILLPAAADIGVALGVVVVTSGGLVGGDRLDISVRCGDGSRAMICAQAAEKVYRSVGPDCKVAVSLAAGGNAWLEWLPQETILFDGARLHRNTAVDAAPSARVLAGEILVFGRRARGERFTRGHLFDRWQVRRGGRLAWADALRVDDPEAAFASPACLAGMAAIATLIYVDPNAGGAVEVARAIGEPLAGASLEFAATLVGGVLIARWLAADAHTLRLAFGRFWAMFRHRVAGLPPVLPRLWSI
ncbi:MAG: urease accessory protein UreD [Defluviicoccus sp.]